MKFKNITDQNLKVLYSTLSENNDLASADKALDLYIKKENKEFNLSFAGHFSAGKSSMINYLLDKDVLPKSPIPTSANIVKINSGDGVARVYFAHEPPVEYSEPYDIDIIKDFCMDKDSIKSLEISTSEPILPKNSSIIDTPGIDAADDADRLMTESSLHLVDSLFYVMDYNHVQSEVNLYFLREIQSMSIPFYVIINQIDKHNDDELSFNEFERSVKETFSQWNVVPEDVLFSSVLNKDAPHNNLVEIKETVFDILEKKPQTDYRIDVATNRVIDEHYKHLEQLTEEKLYDSLENTISNNNLDTFIEMDKSINELNAKFKRLNKRYTDMVNLTLKNAYLMPSSLRDKAHIYLESLESSFKVGMFGAKKKTEEERNRRLTSFLSELQENIDKTIQWSLKERLNTFLSENEIQDENLVQSIQVLEVNFTEEDLKKFLKPGAQVNGQYVLNYTNEISSHIKQLFRNKTNSFWIEVENKLNEEIKTIRVNALSTKEIEEAFAIYQNKKEELNKELKADIADFNHIIANHVSNAEIDTLIENEIYKRSDIRKETLPEINDSHEEVTIEKIEAEEDVNLKENNISTSTIISAIDHVVSTVNELPGFDQLMDDLLSKKDRLENRKLTVALFGAFSAGKSSFSNALFGEQILPVSPNPTTAVINRISPIDNRHPHGTVIITLKDEQTLIDDIVSMTREFSPKNLTFDEYMNWIKQEKIYEHYALTKTYQSYLRAMVTGYDARKGNLGVELEITLDEFASFIVDEEKACYIEIVDLYYDCELTRKGITIVDTPGADSVNARHTNVSFDYIKYADAILYVTYYNHAISSADRDFLMQLGRVKEAFELDKMFFIVNASDLAQSEYDLKLVLDYVKDQLLELGIRFPKVYPVSSKLSLENKLDNLPLNKEMSNFEDDFYQFIENDLAKLTIDSALWDIERGKQLLKNYIETVGLTDEEQTDYIESLKKSSIKMHKLVNEFNYPVYENRLLERITRQLHFVHERLYIRFHDMFTQHFNPTTVTESGRKAQDELKVNRNNFVDYVGYELLQELRAVSLRVEGYLKELLKDVYRQLNENIKAKDDMYLLSSLNDYEVETPEYDQAFLEIDFSEFDQALKTFKNPKAFFEKNEREIMKDLFFEILDSKSKEYLIENEDIMKQAYENQWDKIITDLIKRINTDIDLTVENQISIVTETVDLDFLSTKESELNNVLTNIKDDNLSEKKNITS